MGGGCAAELYSGKGDPGSLKNLDPILPIQGARECSWSAMCGDISRLWGHLVRVSGA